MSRPDFVVIGAMKAATSTLYEQLSRQAAIYMPELKEPDFFSKDSNYDRGASWYSALFGDADEHQITGEASTSYAKFPDFPLSAKRIFEHNKSIKVIYVIRHPINRLKSHYGHEWTMNEISLPINSAIQSYPQLYQYGLYDEQLKQYERYFHRAQILPVFFERLVASPQKEFERILRFLDISEPFEFYQSVEQVNKTKERIRNIPMQSILIDNAFSRAIRRKCVPKSIRNRIKRKLQLRNELVLSPESIQFLESSFNPDLQQLGKRFGLNLTIENYAETVTKTNISPEWIYSS